MSTPFPHLFQPLTLRHRTLRHRLNFGAHTANMSVDGVPGDRHLHYYLERAIGGAAMIVVEPVPVHPTAVLTRANFRPDDDSLVPHFRRITDACHEHGTVMIQQLYHVGAHGDWDNSFSAHWSPSGRPSMHDHDGSHAMTAAEIATLVEAHVRAARRARDAGFDGIELMAAYNALIEQFWSPFTNRRDDRYGGSFERRMRFSAELLEAIRADTGDDFIIGMAVSVDPGSPEVLSLEDQQAIAAWHDERGLYDYVTVGTGSYYDFAPLIPTVLYEDKLGPPFAEAIRRAVKNVVVQAESHIRTPENADYVIASGQADMVSIVRGQIADPHLANKARDGRPENIRPCLSCNQMCWGRRHRDYWISCLINPSAGREFEWGGDRFTRAARRRRILVVGGGPAGCEAARVAAERGHEVVLCEASDRLGGQFRLAGLQPRRQQIIDYLDWFQRQLERLGVEVHHGRHLDAGEVASFAADAVVIATGSLPAGNGWQRGLPQRERLPGVDGANVFDASEVMERSARPGRRVLVLDDVGTWKGAGTAWYLAERGHSVTIVTADPLVGREIVRTAADQPLRRCLKKLGARFLTESAIGAWHGDGATIVDLLDGSERREDFDALVLATVNVPNDELVTVLAAEGLEVHAIGDCVAARQAPAATFDGRRTGLAL